MLHEHVLFCSFKKCDTEKRGRSREKWEKNKNKQKWLTRIKDSAILIIKNVNTSKEILFSPLKLEHIKQKIILSAD